MSFLSDNEEQNDNQVNEYIQTLPTASWSTPLSDKTDNNNFKSNFNKNYNNNYNNNNERTYYHDQQRIQPPPKELISDTLFITNLKPTTTKEQIEDLFGIYGIISSIDLKKESTTAIVIFAIEPFSAQFLKEDLELDGQPVEARFIIPEKSTTPPSKIEEEKLKKIKSNAVTLSLGVFSKPTQIERYWRTPLKVSLTMNTATNCYEIRFQHQGNYYKLDFSYTMLIRGMTLEVTDSTGHQASLSFGLKHPPTIWKEVYSESKKQKIWKRSLFLERGGNFYASDVLKQQQPLTVESHICHINFSQWNAYHIEFSEKDIMLPNFTSMFKKTSDLGILHFNTVYNPTTSIIMTKRESGYIYGFEERSNLIQDQKLVYLLECATTSQCINHYLLDKEFYKMLQNLESTTACQLLECIITENKVEYDGKLALQIAWDKLKTTMNYYNQPILSDDNFTTIYSVYVTPTTLIVQPPRIEQTNRFLRKYKQHSDRFLKVQFVEEDLGSLTSSFLRRPCYSSLSSQQSHGDYPYDNDPVLDRIYKVFMNGIQVGKLTYQFLAYDTTSLKRHSCWFFAPTSTLSADDILNDIGELESIVTLSHYTSAMDICLSPTEQIKMNWGLLNNNNNNNNNNDNNHHGLINKKKKKKNDIKKNDTSTNFIEWIDYVYNNDETIRPGCGKMSAQFAREIVQLSNKSIAVNGTPSAVQFSLGGTIGVLALSNFVSGKIKIQLRPCQYVFNKQPSDFEIVQFSTYKPAFLDRSIITTLTSYGIHEQVFHFMIQHSVQSLNNLTNYPSITYDYLKEFANEFGTVQRMRQMIDAGFLTRLDPFIYNSICAFKFNRLKNIRKFGSLHVKKGAELMVILDDTNTLADNEIFCQLSDLNKGLLSKREVITGACMIFPKPCLHSGDMIIVKAINSPKLRHWNDVIVVSSKQKSLLPSQIVGGQFNGERYTIIWDPQLIPLQPLLETLENKEPPDTSAAKPINRSKAISYFVNYLNNDHRDSIEKYFLRAADKSTRGARDGECTQLSVQYADVMEFLQTPCAIKLEDKSNEPTFPDFLEIPNNPSYESIRLLGRMYRMIQPITYMNFMKDMITKFTDTTVVYDPRLKKDGMEKYIIDAREMKISYEYALKKLMKQYGILTEAEIITGFVVTPIGHQYYQKSVYNNEIKKKRNEIK
ncbi:unnamed protein product [Cunninghamella blakesleeana]